MPDDCCGGGGPAWPGPAPTVWPCENFTGTTTPLPDVLTPSMSWEGMADASTIIEGEPAFSPPEDPALITLVEVRNRLQRSHYGFPNGCFDRAANCHQAFDLAVPQNWRYHAKMLELSYGENPVAGEYLQTFCPCLTRGKWTPNTDSDTPGTMLAYTDDYTIVYISGTSTYQQRALQGASSLLGPSAGDGFGTLAFWNTNAVAIASRILAQNIAVRPNWFIAGHSYGAALASILAGIVQRANPTYNVNLFTCGSPCPGDSRLKAMLDPVNQVHLQNIGDIVCSTPPTGGPLQTLLWLLSNPYRLAWGLWEPHKARVNISPTGVRTAVNEGSIEYGELSTLVNAIVSGLDIAPCPQHAASVYYARCEVIQ